MAEQSLRERVKLYIEEQQLIDRGDHVLAALSGGADSVCLLLLLRELKDELGFTLGAMHVEHGIRGEESLQDAAMCEELCKRLGVTFTCVHVDAKKYSEEHGLSLEEGARALRYDALYKEAKLQGANRIAAAHHREDQAETILFHLFRGSGLRGLTGMQPKRDLLIRPLLTSSKEELLSYLSDAGQTFRTDRTNLDTTYTRNRIRLELFPYVDQNICSDAENHVAEAGEKLRMVQAYLDKQIVAACKRCIDEQGDILANVLLSEEELIGIGVLQEALKRKGFGLKDYTSIHFTELLKLAKGPTGKEIALPGQVTAKKIYERISFEKNESEGMAQKVCIPVVFAEGESEQKIGEWTFARSEDVPEPIPEKPYTKWFDYDKIKSGLCVRTREAGDYLEINREHGRKKLKDYLIDRKIPREERDRMTVLADGSHILWVPGERISEYYKVTPETKRVLRVEVDRDKEKNNG